MTIQWFPGHMAKARRQVEEKLNQVDLVMELLDARLPLSSRNPLIDELVGRRPRIVLLTKSDLADPDRNQEWLRYFKDQGTPALLIDAQAGTGVNEILPLARELLQTKIVAQRKKGIRSSRMRGMILGIPNVGKSSLINRLAKRSAAKTGDRPGITRSEQWIRVGTLELLDTPGILWPKFDDPIVGLRLAASGAIKEELLPTEEVALYLLDHLLSHYPQSYIDRYGSFPKGEGLLLLEQVGRKRGCMQRGGTVDLERAAEVLLRDFRTGKLGRISLERPEDWEKEQADASTRDH